MARTMPRSRPTLARMRRWALCARQAADVHAPCWSIRMLCGSAWLDARSDATVNSNYLPHGLLI